MNKTLRDSTIYETPIELKAYDYIVAVNKGFEIKDEYNYEMAKNIMNRFYSEGCHTEKDIKQAEQYCNDLIKDLENLQPIWKN